MTSTNVFASMTVLVILTLLVYIYMSDSGPTTAHVFVDRKDVELVMKAIINDLEKEASEAIPSRLKANGCKCCSCAPQAGFRQEACQGFPTGNYGYHNQHYQGFGRP